MATSLTLQNDASLAQGYVKVNGTTSATFTTSGITGNLTGNVTGNVTGSLTAGGSLTLATAQTATGTSVDFTGIPSWVKRITVMFGGVSTSGTSNIQIQLGTSSGFTISGYNSYGGSIGTASLLGTGYTSGFGIRTQNSSLLIGGSAIFSLLNSNIWTLQYVFASSSTTDAFTGGGSISISNTLDRLRITTVNGTDTFDAGTINISYEG